MQGKIHGNVKREGTEYSTVWGNGMSENTPFVPQCGQRCFETFRLLLRVTTICLVRIIDFLFYTYNYF